MLSYPEFLEWCLGPNVVNYRDTVSVWVVEYCKLANMCEHLLITRWILVCLVKYAS